MATPVRLVAVGEGQSVMTTRSAVVVRVNGNSGHAMPPRTSRADRRNGARLLRRSHPLMRELVRIGVVVSMGLFEDVVDRQLEPREHVLTGEDCPWRER